MNDILVVVLLLVCLTGVMLWLVGAARRGGALAGSRPLTQAGWVVAGLVAAFSVSAMLGGGLAGAGAGAVCAVLFAVLAGLRLKRVQDVILGGLGVLGVVAGVWRYLADPCSPLPFAVRGWAVVLVAIPTALALLAALLTGRLRLRSGMALFGVIEIVATLSSPFGVSIVETAAPAWIVVCVASGLLGAAAAVAPNAVIGLAGFALAAASVVVSGVLGGPCDAGGAVADFGVLVGYGAVALLAAAVLGVVRR